MPSLRDQERREGSRLDTPVDVSADILARLNDRLMSRRDRSPAAIIPVTAPSRGPIRNRRRIVNEGQRRNRGQASSSNAREVARSGSVAEVRDSSLSSGISTCDESKTVIPTDDLHVIEPSHNANNLTVRTGIPEGAIGIDAYNSIIFQYANGIIRSSSSIISSQVPQADSRFAHVTRGHVPVISHNAAPTSAGIAMDVDESSESASEDDQRGNDSADDMELDEEEENNEDYYSRYHDSAWRASSTNRRRTMHVDFIEEQKSETEMMESKEAFYDYKSDLKESEIVHDKKKMFVRCAVTGEIYDFSSLRTIFLA